ncbi:hypothetical protein HB912_07675 [Listeria aquatica]|uniref:Uncharacterized protein n=1 Tax=Listeria aquatica TaxID=1494960 RepID=A0A841ZMZ5_9LIST|nr:hypothetical protein [Listeria aquatica]MBC1521523.1 hypothetical protein [Listeria aquatica]
MEKELAFGWKVQSNQEVRVFRDGEGGIALFLEENPFNFGGEPPSCLFKLTEEECELQSFSNFVTSVKITLEKQVQIKWQKDFVENLSAEEGVFAFQQEQE